MSRESLNYGEDVRRNMDGGKILSQEREMATIKVEREGHHRGGMMPPNPIGLGESFLERRGSISFRNITSIL